MDEPRRGTGTVTVLVVEDEPGVRSALCLLLELEGFRCIQASNGSAAMAVMENEGPQVVVTDYMMPHMDGLALAKALRADPRRAGLPVLLVTGVPPPECAAEHFVDKILEKPVTGERLTRAIRELLAD